MTLKKSAEEEQQIEVSRNLVGTGCPMNLVYAKAALAGIEQGGVLELILDDGAPVINVARSLEDEGHWVVSRLQMPDATWRLVIRKK